jgi:serine/threonine-protein kinase
VRKLGEGGMGEVYEAVHQVIRRRVAIKVLHPDTGQGADSINRFLNEARAANLIGHPGLVQITDFGTLPGGAGYLVMEYLPGETLAGRIKASGGKLPPEEAVQISLEIASALAACHKKNIIHRDLKPGNVMLVPDPAMATGERLKVLDFGLAKLSEVLEAAFVQTHSAAVLGTPLYMSPEQCEGAGRVDAKTDVYALGCMLYEMLSGRPPFLGEGTGQVIGQHLFKQPEPLAKLEPQLPSALTDLVTQLLVKSKDERPSMRETQKALEALAGELPKPRRRESAEPSGAVTADTLPAMGLASTLGQGAGEPSAPQAPRRPNRMVLAGAAFVSLIGLFLIVRLAFTPRAVPQPTTQAAAAPPAPSVPAPKQVTMRVESEPPGAWVIDESDSEILGKTPWQRQSDARAGQLALTLRLVGHREKSVVLNLDRDDHAYVALTAKTADSATKSKAGAGAKPAKKPVLKRIAAPIKKLAGKIADKFRKKPASGSKSR